MSELGAGNNAEYEAPRDQQTPKLHTSSAPPEGSKMKAGDRIRVTMLARRRGPAADRSQDNLTRCRENVGSQFLSLRQSSPNCACAAIILPFYYSLPIIVPIE